VYLSRSLVFQQPAPSAEKEPGIQPPNPFRSWKTNERSLSREDLATLLLRRETPRPRRRGARDRPKRPLTLLDAPRTPSVASTRPFQGRNPCHAPAPAKDRGSAPPAKRRPRQTAQGVFHHPKQTSATHRVLTSPPHLGPEGPPHDRDAHAFSTQSLSCPWTRR